MVMGMLANASLRCLAVIKTARGIRSDPGDRTGKLGVLMAGPDLSARGGMVSVVEGYLNAGLGERCNLRYIGTMVDGSLVKKLGVAVSSYRAFSRCVRAYDVVHLHMSRDASYTRKRLLALRARRAGVPYILHVHTGEFDVLFERESERKKTEVRELFTRATFVVALSEEWRDYFVSQGCGNANNVVVLHNGVVVPDEPASPDGNDVILFLGCLNERKCPDVLLRAAAMVLPKYPSARIKLAGDGNIDVYRALAEDLDIADRCDFLGWVTGDALERLYREGAVYCLPSCHEGMPMAILEAMAYGLPVITTPVGGVPQVVVDGENGFLTPVDDPAALAACLDALLGCPDERRRIGAAARSTVRERFGIGACLDRLLDLYAAAVGTRV